GDELDGMVVVEIRDDLGDVLGMDLVEQLGDLARALANEAYELGTDEAREAHGAPSSTVLILIDEKPSRLGLDLEVEVVGVSRVEMGREDEVEHPEVRRFT